MSAQGNLIINVIWCFINLFIFVLQNSRDNMSVILITFEGAPQVSEEAIAEVCTVMSSQTFTFVLTG